MCWALTPFLFHQRRVVIFSMCDVNAIGSNTLTSLDFGVLGSQLTEIHVNINKSKFYIIIRSGRKFRKYFWLNIVDQTFTSTFSCNTIKISERIS